MNTTTATAARPRFRNGPGVIVALGALSAFGPLSMDMYLPALDQVVTGLAASPSAVQVSVSACLVGLAVGQLFFGPLSDRYGRRWPLLAGVGMWAVSSALCGLSPGVGWLIAFRFLQGLGGAGGNVTARAIVRDRFEGTEVVRIFSVLMLVSGIAPIVAPLAGGGLLTVMPWEGLFFVLAGLGVVLCAVAWFMLPESLSPAFRNAEGLRRTGRDLAVLVRDPLFSGATAALSLGSICLFGYLVLSSFVFQGQFGLSPTAYSVLFALNSAGIMAAGRVNAVLVGRHAPGRLLTAALLTMLVAGSGMVAAGALGGGFWAAAVPTFVVVALIGVVIPNATGLALAHHGDRAGSASALLGTAQYLVGALVAPVAGALGGNNARTMGATFVFGGAAALAGYGLVARRAARITDGSEPGRTGRA